MTPVLQHRPLNPFRAAVAPTLGLQRRSVSLTGTTVLTEIGHHP